MKRFFKIFVNLTAVLMLAAVCLSFAACEEVKSVELNLQIANYTSSKLHDEKDVKLTIGINKTLAPETSEKILSYISEGYYDNCVFYMDEGFSKQIMVGDLKFDANGNLVQNAIKPALEGEFEKGGVTGSNLKNQNGSVGLWRSWGKDGKNVNNGFDSGRATWFLPSETITEYDGYFCVFATIDLNAGTNQFALGAIASALSGDNYESYVIYFTGEYDETKPDENYGLTFHALKKADFDKLTDDEKDEIFVANKDGENKNELLEFNQKTVRIAKDIEGVNGAMIKSAKAV